MLSAVFKYASILVLCVLSYTIHAQPAGAFINISEELVNNEVTSIIQDKNGFIWFGTRGGLQRFDGYEMKLLKNDFAKGNNLLSQSIEVLQNGRRDRVWIGTKSGGISAYDLKTGRIINYVNDNTGANGFNADYILSILDVDDEKLFIGTWKGVQYLNKKNGRFTVLNALWKTFDIQPDGQSGYWLATSHGLRHLNNRLENDQSYNFGKPGINITAIVKDERENCLWLGTWDKGLIRFDLSTKEYQQFLHQKNDNSSLSSNNTYRLLLDSKGTLWIGTWGGGLNRMNTTTNSFEKVDLNIPGLYTNDNQIILSITEDPSGLLWIGTDGAGVFKFDLNPKRFTNIGYDKKGSGLLTSTHVLSVFVDRFQKLWLGTKGGGIYYSKDWNQFTKINIEQKNDQPPGSSVYECRSFLEADGYLWIATNKGLVRMVNKINGIGNYDIISSDTARPKLLSGRKINALVKDIDGKIWVGTQENGLSCIIGYDQQKRPLFKNYYPDFGNNKTLQNERVSALLMDSRQRLWVGTYKGLYLYNRKTDQFQTFVQNSDPKKSISNNTILCLAEDTSGNIWAGTQSGLNKITGIADGQLQVSSYTSKDGLPSDYIHAVIPDSKGNIWATTNKGIVRFQPRSNMFSVFDKRDGVRSIIFSENASYKDDNGRLFFGGLEGLTYFNPDSIKINRFTPPIYFTNLTINNLPYEFGKTASDSTILEKPFYETENITLDYKENIFAIEFAALDFHAPDKNEYMYKLEGFNKEWIYTGNNRLVSFTNLKAGTYFLKVKASNSDKIWSQTARELKITILPPPWKTWWAYSIYVGVFLSLLWATRYLGLRQAALKNQLILSRIEHQQEKKLANYKEQLFTNISHEFRTPLTLILGPLEDLLQRRKLETLVEKNLKLIQKQSKRMLRMVNQLLDFQKAEAGSLKLMPQPGEIISFCYDVYSLFLDEAQRKSITYTFKADEKYLSFTFDHDKLEIVIFNILSNAIKFTPQGEEIRMTVKRNIDQSCQIIIQDTGSGIPPNEIPEIFNRFYRGKKHDATMISGTGIGLSFVKELIELHKGSILVESDGIKGTTFTVTLPNIQPAENLFQLNENRQQLLTDTNLLMSINSTAMLDENEQLSTEPELPIILIVEDEPDMLQYICDIISPSFKIVTAVNGTEGLAKALEVIPDLVVSDVMMPEMDGIELCKRLKSDKGTSHIPIILLTALTDMTHHLQGIREGADVYLPKPFNSQLLLVHIHNLISSRNLLKELYAKKIFLGSTNFEIKSFEEEFLFKLVKLVEDNISNSEFNNDELANLMFMSRSTFYRKLKAVTGMSGNEFIRTTRLNYAAKLLSSGKYSVTEVAYESGFNDIKYFRKRFQDQFGVTPSEYKQ